MQSPLYLLLAVLSGISFALIGVSLRMGTPKGIHPFHIILICATCGAMVFGGNAVREGVREVLPPVLALGLLAGVTQYGTVHLMRIALTLGPLTALWSAQMLGFTVVILYSVVFLKEGFTVFHLLSLFCAIGCVIFAAMEQGKGTDPEGGKLPRDRKPVFLRYGIVLLSVLFANSFSSVCLKDLSFRETPDGIALLSLHRSSFFFLLYFSLLVCILTDLFIAKRLPSNWKPVLPLGLLCGVGSMGGLWMLSVCASVLPAAVLFTVSSIASILFTAVYSTLFFREKRTLAWYAMVGMGVLAVLLSNGPA